MSSNHKDYCAVFLESANKPSVCGSLILHGMHKVYEFHITKQVIGQVASNNVIL